MSNDFSNKRKSNRAWKPVIMILAYVVVFCTTYALILPAITWERSLICELSEHTHSEECYESVEVPDVRELSCKLEEHVHGDGCFAEEEVLICGLEEGEEHTHTEECYENQNVLVCDKEVHTHTDSCYTVISTKTELVCKCGLKEHTHTDACFDAPPANDPTYICGYVEHTHNEYCYFQDGTLRCTIPEHTHDAGCMPRRLTAALSSVKLQALGAAPATEMPSRTGTDYINLEDDIIRGRYASDPSTSHIETLLNAGGEENGGRIMTDKSVIYKADQYGAFNSYDDFTFGVELSALGQGYDLTVAYQLKTPIDIVFVVDVSASMLRSTVNDTAIASASQMSDPDLRANATIAALNSAIEQIVEDNPLNRVGVVLFSEDSHEFMPLARYKTSDGSSDYLTIGDWSTDGNYYAHINSSSTLQRYNDSTGRYQNVTLSQYQGDYDSNGIASWGGTYTQRGIATGSEMLIDGASEKEVEVEVELTLPDGSNITAPTTVARRPIMILLTDGVPTEYAQATDGSNDYKNPTLDNKKGDGSENSTSGNIIYIKKSQAQQVANGAYGVMRTSSYYKNLISNAYKVENVDNNMLFYSLAMGYFSKSDQHDIAVTMFDPSAENYNTLSDTISTNVKINNRNVASYYYGRQLKDILAADSAFMQNSDIYKYNNAYWVKQFSREELAEAISTIVVSDSVTELYGILLKTLAGVTITDNIGDGMEIKGDPVLNYNEINYQATQKNVNGNVTEYVYGDISSGNQTITATVTNNEHGTQTVEYSVPDTLLPTRLPDIEHKGQYFDVVPARLIYQVGLTDDARAEIEAMPFNGGGTRTFNTNAWGDGEKAETYFETMPGNPYYDEDSYNKDSRPKTENVSGTPAVNVIEYSDETHGNIVYENLGNNGQLVFEADEAVFASVTIKKVDLNGEPITTDTATFSVYRDSALTKLVGTYSSDANGIVNIPALRANKTYYLVETKAPLYYGEFPGAKAFTVDENGNVTGINPGDYYVSLGTDGEIIVKNDYAKTDVKVVKQWAGLTDSGSYPTSVQVALFTDGQQTGAPVTLNAANNWSTSWTGLSKYDSTDWHEIQYDVEEIAEPDGYLASKSIGENGEIVITNNKIGTKKLSVYKKWVGSDGEPIEVELLQNGEPTGDIVTLSSDNNWYYMWEDLPNVDRNGEIVYSVREQPLELYSSDVHLWTGEDDPYGLSISDGPVLEAKTSFENGKTYLLVSGSNCISANAAGTDLDHNVSYTEGMTPEDRMLWVATVDGNGRVTFANKLSGSVLTYSVYGTTRRVTLGHKFGTDRSTAWTVGTNTNGTLYLRETYNNNYYISTSTGTVSSNYSYFGTTTNTGNSRLGITPYVYEEKEIPDPVEKGDTHYIIVNTKLPTKSLSVLKKWVGGDGVPVTVELLKNGESTGKYATLTSDNDWYYMWDDLKKSDENGEITYSVREISVRGYTSDIHLWTGEGDPAGQTVTETTGTGWDKRDSFTNGTQYMFVYKEGNNYYTLRASSDNYSLARNALNIADLDNSNYSANNNDLFTASNITNGGKSATLTSVGRSGRLVRRETSNNTIYLSGSGNPLSYDSENHRLYFANNGTNYYLSGGSTGNSLSTNVENAGEFYIYSYGDKTIQTIVEDPCEKGDTHYIVTNTKNEIEPDSVTLRIRKVSQDYVLDDYSSLVGAKFELYRETAVQTDDVIPGTENARGVLVDSWTTGAVAKDITLDDDGTYYLVETEAPNGFRKLEENVVFTVTSTGDSTERTVTVTSHPTLADGTVTTNIDVPNKSIVPLPATGGTGRNVVYTAGTLIILSALLFAFMTLFGNNREERINKRKH